MMFSIAQAFVQIKLKKTPDFYIEKI